MGHHCSYTANLYSKKDIYFKIKANWKKMGEYVYRENLKGESKCRYIYFSNLAGYTVTFPSEKICGYYGYCIQEKEPMSHCYNFELYNTWETREEDIKELAQNHPEFKYFCAKQRISNIYRFMKALRTYIDHPEIEPLIELGYDRIATDKRLFKLTPKKKREVMSFIKTNRDMIADDTSLTEILSWIKNGIDKPEKLSLNAYRPNNESIMGYSIFIPNSVDLCQRQADELHQCIMKCSYVKEMAKRKLVLVFITTPDGKPLATCEIDNKTKIIRQFYADEIDRDNCLPTKEMREAMNIYLNKLDLNNLYVVA